MSNQAIDSPWLIPGAVPWRSGQDQDDENTQDFDFIFDAGTKVLQVVTGIDLVISGASDRVNAQAISGTFPTPNFRIFTGSQSLAAVDGEYTFSWRGNLPVYDGETITCRLFVDSGTANFSALLYGYALPLLALF